MSLASRLEEEIKRNISRHLFLQTTNLIVSNTSSNLRYARYREIYDSLYLCPVTSLAT